MKMKKLVQIIKDEMRETIKEHFMTDMDFEEVLEKSKIDTYNCTDFHEKYDWDKIDKAIPIVVHEVLKEYHVEEKTWVEATDNDKLDKSFSELESMGLITGQDFDFCLSAGVESMHKQLEIRETKGEKYYGYLFYHWQAGYSARQGDGLYLYYGTFFENGTGDIAKEIGKMISQILRKNGLKVTWDRSPFSAIKINKFKWQKRRMTSSPLSEGKESLSA